MKIWSCKVGETESVPYGADAPMREAVRCAYQTLTGKDPDLLFSGWGAELTEGERAVTENREPNPAADPIAKAEAKGRREALEEAAALVQGCDDGAPLNCIADAIRALAKEATHAG